MPIIPTLLISVPKHFLMPDFQLYLKSLYNLLPYKAKSCSEQGPRFIHVTNHSSPTCSHLSTEAAPHHGHRTCLVLFLKAQLHFKASWPLTLLFLETCLRSRIQQSSVPSPLVVLGFLLLSELSPSSVPLTGASTSQLLPFPWAAGPWSPKCLPDISTWISQIFKISKTQLRSFLPRPDLPPVHQSLNDITFCPGTQVTNPAVFLNISLSLTPKIQCTINSCSLTTSSTALECFHFFSISFAKTRNQAIISNWAAALTPHLSTIPAISKPTACTAVEACFLTIPNRCQCLFISPSMTC